MLVELPSISGHGFSLAGCKISDKPVKEQLLSGRQLAALEEVYALAERKPKEALKQLDGYFASHETHHKVLNCRIRIAILRRRVREANRLIKENYQHNRDIENVSLNYGDSLLRSGRIQDFERWLGGARDLHELFPNRKVYYAGDARAFYTLLAFYFLKSGNKKRAQLYYSNAFKIDPTHRSLRLIEKKLFHEPWLKKIARLVRRT